MKPDIRTLRTPPIVGKRYRVPCAMHIGLNKYVPIVGDWHEDIKHIGFLHKHFHFDWRFITADEWQRIYGVYDYREKVNTNEFALVLWNGNDTSPEPKTRIENRVCVRESVDFTFEKFGPKVKNDLQNAYAEKKLINRICPHKGHDTSSCPIVDGCVKCPLHGLKWNVETGALVRQ